MIKKAALILWCIIWLSWMVFAGYLFHLEDVVSTYKVYYQYTADINDGVASSYEKASYLSYGPYLEQGGMRFLGFLLVGAGLPGLLLVGINALLARMKTAPAPMPARKK